MANVIDCIFPPDRYEFELALRRAFKFVINKEIKSGNEKERETKLVFFDLDTGQDEISNYFQEELFKGKIDAYHILLTLHNPPLDNDLPKYDRIKLFLDYLEKNQLGRKISYFNCVKNLSDLLKNGNLRKPVYRSYENVQHMFYAAVRATFRPLNSKMKSKEIIRKVKHDNIESENHREIFFRSNQGNEMGSDLNDHKMLRSLAQALQEFFSIHSKNSETSKLKVKNHPLDIAYRNRFVTLCRDMGANIVEDVFNWTNETRGSYGQFKVLIIDDNYEPFENQIKVIGSKTKLKFFRLKNEKSWENLYNSLKKYNEAKIEDTANHFVLFARKNELKGEDIEKICADGDKKYFETLITEINKAQIIPMARGSGLRNGNELSLKQFDFFLVDLQFGEQKIGDRMVRYLKRLLEDHRKRSPLLILSLSDDSMDIQRCLNEGARGYIYKERIFSIPSPECSLSK
jgi:CheY-like chemotaxis protein